MDSCLHALQKAWESGMRSVALPLMFSGSMHIPRAEALLIVRGIVEEFEALHPEVRMILVLYKKSIYDLALHMMKKEK